MPRRPTENLPELPDALASGLPEGWCPASLRDVTKDVPNVRPEHEPDRVFQYADISSIDNKRSRIVSLKSFSGKDAPSRARRPVRPGDVLFSNVRTYLRNVALIERDFTPDVCSTGFTILRSNGAVLPRYLLRYVLTDDFIDRVSETQTGTHYPATSDRQVLSQSLPLPPLAEQERIIGLLEQILARLDAARDRLERLPAILSRFRQAVLAAACSGALTAEWHQTRALPKWASLPLEALLKEPLMNGRSVPDADDGFPVLRLTAIRRGRIDLRERKIGAWTAEAASRFRVRCGDFYIARGNGSLALVGRGGLVTDEPDPVAFPDTFIRVRVKEHVIRPRYVGVLWDSDRVRLQIEATARTTAGIFKISQRDLEGFVLPVPSIDEQDEIVRRVSALMAFVDSVEDRVASASRRTEHLRAGVLTRAFRGELVPTEAELAAKEGRSLETASDLLRRLSRARSST